MIETQIRESLAENWLPAIYREKIRPQRTRSIRIDVAPRENQAEIQYTLLGIELKVGRRRFACPDLATARYMRVFARIGCGEFAIPYDITMISTAADELETSWQRALLLAAEKTNAKPSRVVSLARGRVVKAMREEISEIGAGEAMPQFDRETRQKRA
ncbi:MAG: hypothetical protein ABJB40_03540 [Acidobacteriota bacterium]